MELNNIIILLHGHIIQNLMIHMLLILNIKLLSFFI